MFPRRIVPGTGCTLRPSMNKARVRHFHVLTGRPLLGSFVRGTRDRLREIFGRLRALDGDSPAEDETGHAVDSHLLGGISIARDALHIVSPREALAHLLGIEAACGRSRNQHLAIREIAAFGEISSISRCFMPAALFRSAAEILRAAGTADETDRTPVLSFRCSTAS
jgi:hypothetical protein